VDAGLVSGIRIYRDEDHIGIRYRDGTEFFLSRDGGSIWGTWPDALTLEDTATYLLGPIFNILLRLRGTLSLHGSAVRIGDVAAVFVGPQGAGKSTTAAIFATAGHSVLTDDIAAIEDAGGVYRILPSYPRVRLWPESVELLFGASDRLPLLTPTWDKRYLELGSDTHKFQSEPVPLAAIYILDRDEGGSRSPEITAISPREALITLIGNMHANYILDEVAPDRTFACLQRIIASTPVRRLMRADRLGTLSDLRDIVVADVESLPIGAMQHV
jgi:hypothetical protein